MPAVLRDMFDRLLGRGTAAVTVPPLDGALKPNNLIEEASPGHECPHADNLAICEDQLLFSSGKTVLSVGFGEGSNASPRWSFESPVTAIAARDGSTAVAVQGEGISIFDDSGTARLVKLEQRRSSCVTAMTFAPDGDLLACVGSSENTVEHWQRDLLSNGKSGSVLRIDATNGEIKPVATGLAFPNGVLPTDDGRLVVAESWSKRLLLFDGSGKRKTVAVDDLPGYPARLSRAPRGGYWLALFAPRNQLIEFVMRERDYRRTMMAEVAPHYWIAPALHSGASFHEPIQGGALKQMGVLKPWAPTLSYGLAVKLDENFEPIFSVHSRAGGRRHGITSAIEKDGRLWLTSKGGGEVLAISLSAAET